MNFMFAYKRLDKLCKECYGSETGISTYISLMERSYNNRYKCIEWEIIYNTLKHYRYMRNQISHNPDVDESDICTATDIVWIEDYYNRIINQTDALAIYRQREIAEKNQRETTRKAEKDRRENLQENQEQTTQKDKKSFIEKIFDKIKKIFGK